MCRVSRAARWYCWRRAANTVYCTAIAICLRDSWAAYSPGKRNGTHSPVRALLTMADDVHFLAAPNPAFYRVPAFPAISV
jgi:hypothetical protein